MIELAFEQMVQDNGYRFMDVAHTHIFNAEERIHIVFDGGHEVAIIFPCGSYKTHMLGICSGRDELMGLLNSLKNALTMYNKILTGE